MHLRTFKTQPGALRVTPHVDFARGMLGRKGPGNVAIRINRRGSLEAAGSVTLAVAVTSPTVKPAGLQVRASCASVCVQLLCILWQSPSPRS